MSSFGIAEDAVVEALHIVRAEDRHVALGEREIDQRFVPRRFHDLRRVPPGPERLTDEISKPD